MEIVRVALLGTRRYQQRRAGTRGGCGRCRQCITASSWRSTTRYLRSYWSQSRCWTICVSDPLPYPTTKIGLEISLENATRRYDSCSNCSSMKRKKTKVHSAFTVIDFQMTCQYPENCVPINTNVLTFDFGKLGAIHRRMTGQLFDVIMMDPPWQLSSSNPTRGVAIAYDTLGDAHIRGLPLARLQDSGFLFLWTINAKFSACFQMMLDWGYTFIDDICWVKELSLIHICRCRRYAVCRSRWSPYH
eukprot:TRINITY_DN7925_c0_g1_i12.p2 TRINITY_DN7925_c0_g1~~TRINITY_DN7925_c0_g1_i12.p2  ORF type:complete len:246 (-),score=13.26 TRINITY_DN7925_c0_g1_i12:19-756(-)